MATVGKRVALLGLSGSNIRNGEGSFLRMKDGRIMYAYTRFEENGEQTDFAGGSIYAVYSGDEGETWSEPSPLMAKDEEALNHMCINLIRMKNGDMGMLFMRKMGYLDCTPYFTVSHDEGKTWETPWPCTDKDGYFVVNNNRLIRLKDGTLIFPMNDHTRESRSLPFPPGVIWMIASYDDGNTWQCISGPVSMRYAEYSKTGLQETGLYEKKDGELIAYSRTDMGLQYVCRSCDGGKTWNEPYPCREFSSPDSPMKMFDLWGKPAIVFNPIPKYNSRRTKVWGGRTPLLMSLSDNGGESFDRHFYLEEDPENNYCYPAVFAENDYVLVSYYHSIGTDDCLKATVIKKVLKKETE